MVGRFYFGRGRVDGKIVALDCPNEIRGIGDICIYTTGLHRLWTGDVWLGGVPEARFSFASLTSVSWYRDKDELRADAVVHQVFSVPKGEVFTYKAWYKRARQLRKRKSLWARGAWTRISCGCGY